MEVEGNFSEFDFQQQLVFFEIRRNLLDRVGEALPSEVSIRCGPFRHWDAGFALLHMAGVLERLLLLGLHHLVATLRDSHR